MANWKSTRIGKFLKEREGRYDPADSNIQSLKRLNKIDFSGEIHLSDKDSKTDMIIVEPGDLVISGINVSKGALAVYHGKEPVTATIHYSSYIFDKSQIEIEYFKRFVKSEAFVKALKEQVKGGIKTEIKPKHFLPLEIDLPDIEEQGIIVSFFQNIENEMKLLNENINQQQDYLKKLRQQILQEAIEGKLTADWRNKNPKLISGENHASKLLEKIKAEKARLIKEGKIKKEKPLAPITNNDKSFEIPDSWVWCCLGDICTKVTDGFHHTPRKFKEGAIYISATHIREQGIDWKNCLYISAKDHAELFKKAYPQKGEILITNRGAGCGTPAIIDINKEFSFQNAALIGFNQNLLKAKYIFNFILRMREIVMAEFVNGGLQPMLSNVVLKTIPFPLPPQAEQQAIVERIDKLSYHD